MSNPFNDGQGAQEDASGRASLCVLNPVQGGDPKSGTMRRSDMRELLLSTETAAGALARGHVVRVTRASVFVASPVFPEEGRLCDVLQTSSEPPRFAQGDVVLIWRSPEERVRDVVVGRIGVPASSKAGRNEDEVLP